jgi:phospholipase/lecithinase/hemolysin
MLASVSLFAFLRREFPKVTCSILGMSIGTGIGIAISVTSISASAMPIVAFGDSLSDTGNVAIATDGAIPPSAFYFSGRFSNGPIWLDRLGAVLGSAVEPSLARGNNFAFGAARTQTSPLVPSLRTQANAFLSRTAATGADPNSLYVVFGGSNDIRDAIGSADPVGAVTTAARQLAGIVGDLVEAGAVDIVVPTLGNVGRAPEARLAGDAVVNLAGLLTQTFNQTLSQALAGLDASDEVNLIRPDFFGLLETITASPSNFGLTNVTDACLPVNALSVPADAVACSDPDRFLFWDLQHPTTVTHSLFANVALDAIRSALNPVSVPEPWPAALMAPLLLVGLVTRFSRGFSKGRRRLYSRR